MTLRLLMCRTSKPHRKTALWTQFNLSLIAITSNQSNTKGRGGTHLSEGLTGLAEKTKEQTIKQ